MYKNQQNELSSENAWDFGLVLASTYENDVTDDRTENTCRVKLKAVKMNLQSQLRYMILTELPPNCLKRKRRNEMKYFQLKYYEINKDLVSHVFRQQELETVKALPLKIGADSGIAYEGKKISSD